MTKKKSNKRALLMSALALLMCLSMFIGSTFAWFTDSVTSGSNVITAGNLDLVVEYTLDGENWSDLEGAEDLFQKGLWEPGHTEVVALRIKNNGTLALKYVANMNILSETVGKTKDGEDIVLSDILTVSTLIQQAVDADGIANQIGEITLGLAFSSENSVDYGNTTTFKAGNVLGNDVELHPGAAHYLIVKVDMAETVGNEANHNGTDIPKIEFGINVLATQFTYESDSFDDQYDAGAEFPWSGEVDTSWFDGTATTYEIYTAAQLAGVSKLASEGHNFTGITLELMNDIDLFGQTWVPIQSFAGKFDGNGHTIQNFVIDATSSSGGLFRTIEAGEGERVHDLTIKGVDATVGNARFGTLANTIKGIVNRVTISDVEVTTTASTAWVGGMCAFMSWPWMNDCTVENMVVDATAGAEFVAGFSPILQKNSNMVFTNCDVNGFKVTVNDTDGSCGVGGFAGQTQRGWEDPSLKDCDVTGIDIVATGTVDIGGFMAWPGGHTIATNCTTEGKIDASGVTGTDNFVGGFFGNLGWNCDLGKMGHVITNCTADVDIISGGAPAGGFVGSATNSYDRSMYATFVDCKATGDVTNNNGSAGGFAGEADRGDYDNCSATGTVTGTVCGGFIGHIKDVTPHYDGRYPADTRSYNVDEIFIDKCTGTTELDFIGQIDEGTNVTIDGVKR